jgi:NADH-quinone oxidoreductase subunit K
MDANFLIAGMLVFLIGSFGVFFRKDAISLFMCIELMLNGVNITLASFSRFWGGMHGQITIFFVIAIAAAEAAIGFALMLQIYRHKNSIQLNEITDLRDLRGE